MRIAVLEHFSALPAGEAPPALLSAGRALLRAVAADLAALRPEEREVIVGRVEMGYTYQELADVLGKPSSEAARKAAERALIRLAEEMGRASD